MASTNPRDRLNQALKRRSQVVGSFPNRAAVLRLVGARLGEPNDEWRVGRHAFRAVAMNPLTGPSGDGEPVQLASPAV